jgi:SAM-dependent methyltransferase
LTYGLGCVVWQSFRRLTVFGLSLAIVATAFTLQAADPATNRYEFRPASRDGIGKVFLGREIAHVMGHQGADWLERPEREQEERASLVIPALKLKPGEAVADLGCGTGYFSWRLAQAVGTNGLVYGVDIQQEMLDLLDAQMKKHGVTNVQPVLGTITDPKLPARGLDLVLMVDVYHEFDHPYEMMQKICTALKPGGRVAFVEFRGEDPAVPIKPLHKMTEAQVRKEMSIHPLEWVETIRTLPRQHLIIFRRR